MNMNNKRWLLILAAGISAITAYRVISRRRRRYDFLNKNVLITGGSRGLGLVLAREFASAGARIAICARDSGELERAAGDLRARNAEVYTITCDVTDPDDLNRMFQSLKDHFGSIDILVNNAGIIQVAPMDELRDEDYVTAMNTHFWAAKRCIDAVLPEMRARHSGRIVNIASLCGKISVPHMLSYNTSKFALVGYSSGLRAETAKDKVYVTTVCPGIMQTGSHLNAKFKGFHRSEYTIFSLMGAMPVTSVDVKSAAGKILDACRYGDAELIFPIQMRILTQLNMLLPQTSSELLSLANRFLPGPGGIGTNEALGRESQTALSPSILTTNIDMAALRNYEIE